MPQTSKEDVGMSVVGIDPGSSGAIVLLSPHPAPPQVWNMPTINRVVNGRGRTEVNGYKLASIFEYLKTQEPDHIIVEHLWPWAKDTALTAWSLSGRYNRCLQGLESLGLEYHLVAPVKWKGVVMGSKDNWKGDKEASIRYIEKEYPKWPLKIGRQRVPQDGIADAYCLALYGRRTYEI